MKEFDDIYVSWRAGQGKMRRIVGVLQKSADGRFIFSYDKQGVEKAKQDGFLPYTELPKIDQTYNGNVLDIFTQRLMKPERSDIQSFYSFWEIEPQYQDDKYYLLAHTQGLLPTDNFEFLADYNPVEGLHFVTDLANLSKLELLRDTVRVGDVLSFQRDPQNPLDDKAVKVFKGGQEVGYIKKVHSRVFYKPGAERLKLTVKAVDQNGFIKRIFLKVSL